MANNFVRQINTLPNFGVDVLLDAAKGIAIGDAGLGQVIPAGKVVVGAILRNMKDDLASGGAATLRVKVGSTSLGEAATAIASIKGTSVYVPVAAGHVCATDEEIKLTVGTAALTAGNVDVIVLYV